MFQLWLAGHAAWNGTAYAAIEDRVFALHTDLQSLA